MNTNYKHRADAILCIAFRDASDPAASITHARRVSARVAGPTNGPGAGPAMHRQAVALLHDIFEDSTITADMLRPMFNSDIIANVQILTRKPPLTYAAYIDLIVARGSDASIMVKLADVYDHLDPARYANLSDSHLKRYYKARTVLEAGVKSRGLSVRESEDG